MEKGYTVIKQIAKEDTWEIRHKVMWPEQPFDFIKLEEDEMGTHYGLFDDEKLVSVISIVMNEKGAQFHKFATLDEYQGKGLGSQLLTFVFEQLQAKEVKRVWCNSRENKVNFYKKFGMRETGQTFEKMGKRYIVMEKQWI